MSLFGEACSFGLRRSLPPIANPGAFLQVNDTINYIRGCEEPSEDPYERTKQPGMDMTYCPYDRNMRVTCRFNKHEYHDGAEPPSKRLRSLILRRDPHLPSDLEDIDDDNASLVEVAPPSPAPSIETLGPLVEIDDDFVLDGEDVHVVSVGASTVTVEAYDGRAAWTISLQAAREAIEEDID